MAVIVAVGVSLAAVCLRTVAGSGSLFDQLAVRVGPAPLDVVPALLATGALVTLAAIGIYRWSECRVRDRGLLDQTTGS